MTDSSAPVNPWEELQRLRKAIAIADVLDAWQADHETAAGLDSAGWSTASLIAEQKPPSATTRDLVCDLLKARARARSLVAAP